MIRLHDSDVTDDAQVADKLAVLHVAPIFSPVPPLGYGGVERAVHELSSVQAGLGWYKCVDIAASLDSTTGLANVGRYSSIRSIDRDLSTEECRDLLAKHYTEALQRFREYDVLHAHGTWSIPYCADVPQAVLVSVYTDLLDSAERSLVNAAPRNVRLIANSASTQSKLRTNAWFAMVLEGLTIRSYPISRSVGDYIVFIGDLTEAKGVDIAIQAAHATGVKLKIIGRPKINDVGPKVLAQQQTFLDQHVFPYCDGQVVEYLGELGEERLMILSEALALVSPIRWEEPFGRAVAEALACGTPVLAFKRGALAEYVVDGENGYLVDDFQQMTRRLELIHTIDRAKCRESAERRLSMERVAHEYDECYRRVISEGTGNGL